MQVSGKDWQDLPKPMNLFTTRNAALINLNTGKAVQHYSANTKIVVTQKCVTPEKTFYRTESAALQNLNWAFEASAFGMPNDIAPAEPSGLTPNLEQAQTVAHFAEKQTQSETAKPSKAGEKTRPHTPFWKRFFRK